MFVAETHLMSAFTLFFRFCTTNIYCHCCCWQYYYETCEKWPVVVAVHRNARVNSFEILLALMSHQSVFSEQKTKRHSKQLDSYFVFIFDECVDFRFPQFLVYSFPRKQLQLNVFHVERRPEQSWIDSQRQIANEDMWKTI